MLDVLVRILCIYFFSVGCVELYYLSISYLQFMVGCAQAFRRYVDR